MQKMIIDIKLLSKLLGVKVIEVFGHKKSSLRNLKEEISNYKVRTNIRDRYVIYPELEKYLDNKYNRYISINILRKDKDILKRLNVFCNIDIPNIDEIIVNKINDQALDIYNRVVYMEKTDISVLDKIFTSKKLGIPIMILFLGIILFLSIKISNYPSALLFNLFSVLEKKIFIFLSNIMINPTIIDLFINGYLKWLSLGPGNL